MPDQNRVSQENKELVGCSISKSSVQKCRIWQTFIARRLGSKLLWCSRSVWVFWGTYLPVVLGSAAQVLNEASNLCWISRHTPFSWLCIKQFECRLNGPESLSAGSMTENSIVVSQREALSTSWRHLLCTHQASVCCTGTLSLRGVFLWAQPPTAVKHSRFWEHIIKHFGFSYFVAK